MFNKLASIVLFLKWKFKRKKEDKICDCGCGVTLKMLPYDHDVHDTKLMLHTISRPASAKAKAFYDSVGHKVNKEETHNWHGEEGFSSVYRGPGGPGCSD